MDLREMARVRLPTLEDAPVESLLSGSETNEPHGRAGKEIQPLAKNLSDGATGAVWSGSRRNAAKISNRTKTIGALGTLALAGGISAFV